MLILILFILGGATFNPQPVVEVDVDRTPVTTLKVDVAHPTETIHIR